MLRGCRRSSSDIKCNFVISTKKEGKYPSIFTGKGNSSIVDSAGRTYPSSNLEYNGSNASSFSQMISPGVDYVIDINFENIPGQIKKTALLNIVQPGTVVQFRDVPILN